MMIRRNKNKKCRKQRINWNNRSNDLRMRIVILRTKLKE